MNNSVGIPGTASLVALGTSVIQTKPNMYLDVAFKQNGTNGISRTAMIFPKNGDYTPGGFYYDASGNRMLLTTFLNNFNEYPIQQITGNLYFEVLLQIGEQICGVVFNVK